SFFLNDGTKALLFATKEATGQVTFKVARYDEASAMYEIISLAEAGFAGTTSFSPDTTYVRYLQIDNKVFALADSTNPDDTARIFYVGAEKKIVAPKEIDRPEWITADAPQVIFPDAAWINSSSKTTIPAAETPTAGTANQPLTGTLISSTAADNTFNFGYFYTLENELGETAASQMTVVKTKRGWSQWQFETAHTNGGPSGTGTSDPTRACDQLVATIPSGTWTTLMAQGAVRWNLYMATWSDTGAVPVEGTLVASRDLTSASTRAAHGWAAHTPV